MYNTALNNNKNKKMPRPFSEDLRERVLKVVDEKKYFGGDKQDLAICARIQCTTISKK
jgi:hypothetical protein